MAGVCQGAVDSWYTGSMGTQVQLPEFAWYVRIPSPHEAPLVRAVAERVGAGRCAYWYGEALHADRAEMGWPAVCDGVACERVTAGDRRLAEVPVLYLGAYRLTGLIEARAKAGLKTFFVSERWLTPPLGLWRLAWPPFLIAAWRMMRLLRGGAFVYLAQGIHAGRDFARLAGVFSGDMRCLFRAPKTDFERRPGGRPLTARGATGTRLWGYFVAPGGSRGGARPAERPKRLLWAGRMLPWKRVDTLILAVRAVPEVTLDLYGHGPAEPRWKRLAEGCGRIRFHGFVSGGAVRELMHSHDLYVLPSGPREGWGAVVSECLEEGCPVIATQESGAGATLLPERALFPAGDTAALIRLLGEPHGPLPIGLWTAAAAADALLELARGRDGGQPMRTDPRKRCGLWYTAGLAGAVSAGAMGCIRN